MPTHFHNNSGTYTYAEHAYLLTSSCALVGIILYTITHANIFINLTSTYFLQIILCIYCDDVHNQCFFVNVITVNSKVDSKLNNHYFHVAMFVIGHCRSFYHVTYFLPSMFSYSCTIHVLI